MKYSKKVAKLDAAKRWFDAQSQKYKDAHTKPGSVKWS